VFWYSHIDSAFVMDGFALNDVVLWNNGSDLWRIIKLNKARPRLQSCSARKDTTGAYTNLRVLGTIDDIYGTCNKCGRLGVSNATCRRGRIPAFVCGGQVTGNMNWMAEERVVHRSETLSSGKIKKVTPDLSNAVIENSMKHFAEMMGLCGVTVLSEEHIWFINDILASN
jgi:hypothetical protein